MLAANALAFAAPTLALLGGVFVLFGVQMAAVNVSNLSILLEFAPDPGARPTYVGLGTTAMAPVAFASPLAAGLLVDALGFRAVLGIAMATGAGALALLLARVHDPRHAAGGTLLEPGT
jgi:MFS family permease